MICCDQWSIQAIATGIAQMTTAVIASVDHGTAAARLSGIALSISPRHRPFPEVIKRVIMERDTYNMWEAEFFLKPCILWIPAMRQRFQPCKRSNCSQAAYQRLWRFFKLFAFKLGVGAMVHVPVTRRSSSLLASWQKRPTQTAGFDADPWHAMVYPNWGCSSQSPWPTKVVEAQTMVTPSLKYVKLFTLDNNTKQTLKHSLVIDPYKVPHVFPL